VGAGIAVFRNRFNQKYLSFLNIICWINTIMPVLTSIIYIVLASYSLAIYSGEREILGLIFTTIFMLIFLIIVPAIITILATPFALIHIISKNILQDRLTKIK
jgi:hypothetical protein